MPAPRVTSHSPWHLVLVMDDSGSMAGDPAADLNEAILELKDALVTASMGQKPYFRVSVVSFGSSYNTLIENKSENDLDEALIASFKGESGSTNASAALDEATRILSSHPGEETDFEPFVFFFSDGAPDNEDMATAAADRLKSLETPAGMPRLVALGFGQPNHEFMKIIASNECYVQMESSKDIIRILPSMGSVGTSAQIEGADGVLDEILKL